MEIDTSTDEAFERECRLTGRYDLLQTDTENFIVPNTTVGEKFSKGKPRYSLLPAEALHEVVKVLTFGAEKYSDDNWKIVPNLQTQYSDAAGRHRFEGAKVFIDDESNLPHLAHEISCLLFKLQDMLEEK